MLLQQGYFCDILCSLVITVTMWDFDHFAASNTSSLRTKCSLAKISKNEKCNYNEIVNIITTSTTSHNVMADWSTIWDK